MGNEIHWMEIRVLVPEGDGLVLEALEAELLALTPGGFASEAWDAPPSDRLPVPPGWTRYLVYVGEAEVEDARVRLEHLVAGWPGWSGATVEVARLPEGWRDRWKMYFKPIIVSDRLVVAPPWEVPEIGPGTKVLVVEPGMAFGTAQHETTALCLEGIDARFRTRRYDKVLDVGCGTGILAIAAGMFGAREVFGNDVDPNAVLAARENEALNRQALGETRCGWATTPIEDVPGAWDLVVANILTPTLIVLAGPIAARVAVGGELILSGILAEHEAEIVQAFVPHGLTHVGTARRNGWIRVDFARM